MLCSLQIVNTDDLMLVGDLVLGRQMQMRVHAQYICPITMSDVLPILIQSSVPNGILSAGERMDGWMMDGKDLFLLRSQIPKSQNRTQVPQDPSKFKCRSRDS